MENITVQSRNAFLALLAGAVHRNPLPQMNISAPWENVFELAAAHNVFALVFEKASEFPSFRGSPDYPTFLKKAMRQVVTQERCTQAFLQLYRTFSDAGLHPLVLKGIICRELYGELREYRPSGDEDLLIQKRDFPQIQSILEAQGYHTEYPKTDGRQLELLPEISFWDGDSGLHIEVHINPFGFDNWRRSEMNTYFRDVFQNAKKLWVDGTELWTMGDTEHFLFLVLHAFKHMMMANGVGIRQVLDILLYQEAYQGTVDWEYVNRVLTETDSLRFWSDLVWIGNRSLGFHLGHVLPPLCPERLLEEILGSGAFGTTTQAQRSAYNFISAAVSQNGGIVRTWICTLFPDRQSMVGQYPQLVSRPYLLPVCWGKRFARFLHHNRQNQGRLAQESLEIGKRRIELLKKYGVL